MLTRVSLDAIKSLGIGLPGHDELVLTIVNRQSASDVIVKMNKVFLVPSHRWEPGVDEPRREAPPVERIWNRDVFWTEVEQLSEGRDDVHQVCPGESDAFLDEPRSVNNQRYVGEFTVNSMSMAHSTMIFELFAMI